MDSVLFIAAPLNAENRADAMALSVEGSIMRNANSHRPFTAGLYLGRHVNGDIYRVVPPAESIATLVANGAKGLHIYGYSGLDDGGVMFRMDEMFKDSLRAGNRWAAEVMPLLDAPRAKEVALLFPAEMSLYEPLEVDIEGRHRMDLLGWYQQFTDLGWHVDIVHPDQVVAGVLADYKHLVVPTNSLYDLGDNAALEAAVENFVCAGGNVFHGPHCELAKRALGIEEEVIRVRLYQLARGNYSARLEHCRVQTWQSIGRLYSVRQSRHRGNRASAKVRCFHSASNTATPIPAAPCQSCRRNTANAKCTQWCCSSEPPSPRSPESHRSHP